MIVSISVLSSQLMCGSATASSSATARSTQPLHSATQPPTTARKHSCEAASGRRKARPGNTSDHTHKKQHKTYTLSQSLSYRGTTHNMHGHTHIHSMRLLRRPTPQHTHNTRRVRPHIQTAVVARIPLHYAQSTRRSYTQGQ